MTEDDKDAIVQLHQIRWTALKNYPYPPGVEVDDRYALAFGIIAGICTEALDAVKEDRPPHFGIDLSRISIISDC